MTQPAKSTAQLINPALIQNKLNSETEDIQFEMKFDLMPGLINGGLISGKFDAGLIQIQFNSQFAAVDFDLILIQDIESN